MDSFLPREPRVGDFFLGEVTACYKQHRGLLVSAPEFPLYMPLELIEDMRASPPNGLIGKWVECEIVGIVTEKRAIVVRPIAWFDSERETTESYNRVRAYWNTQKQESEGDK